MTYQDTRTEEQKYTRMAAKILAMEGFRCKYDLIKECKNDTERSNVLKVAEQYFQAAAFFFRKHDILVYGYVYSASYAREISRYLHKVRTVIKYKMVCLSCFAGRFYDSQIGDLLMCINYRKFTPKLLVDTFAITGDEWNIKQKNSLMIDFTMNWYSKDSMKES